MRDKQRSLRRPKEPRRPRRGPKESRRRRRRQRRGLSRRERVALHRAQLDELRVWVKGVGLESRRRAKGAWAGGRRRAEPVLARARKWLAPVATAIGAVLRPLGRAIRAVLAPIAPYASAVILAPLYGLGALLDAMLAALSWARDRIVGAARAVARWVDAHVTPARTFALIAAVAAVALAASQFIDYRATAIGAEQYEGEVQTVAPPPSIDQKPAGDPHFYALLPLAIAALPLTWLALRGRRRLALWVAAIGAVGVVVTLAVDLPQGLETGRAGDAYEGTEAQLIEGFWTQLIASLALVGCGLGLSRANTEAGRNRNRDLAAGSSVTQGGGPGRAAGWGAGA